MKPCEVVKWKVGLCLTLVAVGGVASDSNFVSTELFRPISGGSVASDALDVRSRPELALIPTAWGGAADPVAGFGPSRDSMADAAYAPKATTPLTCTTIGNSYPPNGWTVTYTANSSVCTPPFTPGYHQVCWPGYCYNQYRFTSYFDVPVGGTLRYCSAVGVPEGWVVIQTGLPASCGTSGPDFVMQHVSCISGRDTNCYPQSASINAWPQTVTVPYGSTFGEVTVGWNTTNANNACVWVQNSGGAVGLWSCMGGGANNQVWPYVPAGGTSTFWVSGGGNTSASPNLAQVVVTGVAGTAPTISASPTVVNVPSGQSYGSTAISYSIQGSGYNGICIWISQNAGPPSLWACEGAQSGTLVWPYVPKGGSTEFGLSRSSTSYVHLTNTVVVFGQ